MAVRRNCCTVQPWTCELGYGADTMFHRTYFLFCLLLTVRSVLKLLLLAFLVRRPVGATLCTDYHQIWQYEAAANILLTAKVEIFRGSLGEFRHKKPEKCYIWYINVRRQENEKNSFFFVFFILPADRPILKLLLLAFLVPQKPWKMRNNLENATTFYFRHMWTNSLVKNYGTYKVYATWWSTSEFWSQRSSVELQLLYRSHFKSMQQLNFRGHAPQKLLRG